MRTTGVSGTVAPTIVNWLLPATRSIPIACPEVPTPTVTATEALWPPTAAVIVVLPVATPVTSPVAVTRAFVVSLLVHVTPRQPASGAPLALRASTNTWPPEPTPTLSPALGLTATDAIGGTTKVDVAVRDGAESPIANRATCCASITLIALSPVSSPMASGP